MTSSRNSTPPAASSIWPGLDCCAPVNAPRSYPNSSDSSSCSGSAAQFSATNGPRRRADARWMNRATTSLPVPDSPVSSTVVSVSATCVARLSTSRHSGDWPTTRTVPVFESSSSASSRTRASSRSARACASATCRAASASCSCETASDDVIRDTARDRQITWLERAHPLRPEGQPDFLLAGPRSHLQERQVPRRDQSFPDS